MYTHMRVYLCGHVCVRVRVCARQKLACACRGSSANAVARLVVAGVGAAAARAGVIIVGGVVLWGQAARPAAGGGTRRVGSLLGGVLLAAMLGSVEAWYSCSRDSHCSYCNGGRNYYCVGAPEPPAAPPPSCRRRGVHDLETGHRMWALCRASCPHAAPTDSGVVCACACVAPTAGGCGSRWRWAGRCRLSVLRPTVRGELCACACPCRHAAQCVWRPGVSLARDHASSFVRSCGRPRRLTLRSCVGAHVGRLPRTLSLW
jgi:hypothetical protein